MSTDTPPESLKAVLALRPPLATSTRTDLAPSFKLLRTLVDTVWGTSRAGARGLEPGLWRRQFQRAAQRAGALVGAVWEKCGGPQGVMVDDEGEGGRGVMKMQGVLSDVQLFAASLASTTDPLSTLLLDAKAYQRTCTNVANIMKKLAGLATHYSVVDELKSPPSEWPAEDAQDQAEDMAALPILIAKSRPNREVLKKFAAIVEEQAEAENNKQETLSGIDNGLTDEPASMDESSPNLPKSPSSQPSLGNLNATADRRASSVPVKGGASVATSGLTAARRADFLRFVYSENTALIPKQGGIEAAVAAAATVISQPSANRQASLGIGHIQSKDERGSLVKRRVASFASNSDDSPPLPSQQPVRRGASESSVTGRKWTVDMSGMEPIQRRTSGTSSGAATPNGIPTASAPRLSVSGVGVTWEAGKRKETDSSSVPDRSDDRSSRASSRSAFHPDWMMKVGANQPQVADSSRPGDEKDDKGPGIASFAEQAAAIVAARKRRVGANGSPPSSSFKRPAHVQTGVASTTDSPPKPITDVAVEASQVARRASSNLTKEPVLSPILASPPSDVTDTDIKRSFKTVVDKEGPNTISLQSTVVKPDVLKTPTSAEAVKTPTAFDVLKTSTGPTPPRITTRTSSISSNDRPSIGQDSPTAIPISRTTSVLSSSSKTGSLSVPYQRDTPRPASSHVPLSQNNRPVEPESPGSDYVSTDLVDDASILDAISTEAPEEPKPSVAEDPTPVSPEIAEKPVEVVKVPEEPSLADLAVHASMYEGWGSMPDEDPVAHPSAAIQVAPVQDSAPSTPRSPGPPQVSSPPIAQTRSGMHGIKSLTPLTTASSTAIKGLERSPSIQSFSGMSWATSFMSAAPAGPDSTFGSPNVAAGLNIHGGQLSIEAPTSLRILSIDGGGIRGLASLLVIRELMRAVKENKGMLGSPRPCDCFDVICGAGTGGIIALLLGRLQMDVETAIDAYLSLARNVFGHGKGAIAVLLGKTRYSASRLEAAMQDVVQSAALNAYAPLADPDSTCRTFVLAMRSSDGSDGSSRTLRSYHTREVGPDRCTIYQAARATSAAPLFFKPVEVDDSHLSSLPNNARLNNPASEAMNEIRSLFPGSAISCLVSVGAGLISPGNDRVSKACAEICASCEAAASSIASQATKQGWASEYVRFNIDQGLNGYIKEWTFIREITEATRHYMNNGALKDRVVHVAQSIGKPLMDAASPSSLVSSLPSPSKFNTFSSRMTTTSMATSIGKVTGFSSSTASSPSDPLAPTLSLKHSPNTALPLHDLGSTTSFHIPDF